MSRTLKEQYEIKQLQQRLKPIDQKVMTELRAPSNDKLILEAFNKQQMNDAIKIVKQLKTINFGPLTSLSQARDAAVNDVTRALAGGKDQGIIRKIVNLFKGGKENPLVDALAFCDALNNFFGQFSQYVTALGSDKADQPLSTIVTGKSSEELSDQNAINNLDVKEKGNLKNMQKVIVNGLKPSGALGKLGKNWIDKYLRGKKGLQSLARDLLKMSPNDINKISQTVTSSLKNAEAIGQAAAGASQQATVGSNPSASSNVSGSSQPEQGTAGTKSGATAPGAHVPPNTAKGVDIDKVVARIKPAMDDLGVKDVSKLVSSLDDLGVLKNP